VLAAILRAVSRAVRRDFATFRSIQVNNFFLFVALLMYGALESGLPPRSAYPFLLLAGLLLVFPLSSDPLARIPPSRLEAWPLARRQRFALRMASVALSPVFWAGTVILAATSPGLALSFLGLVAAAQMLMLAGQRPGWAPRSAVPPLPGRLGLLIRKDVRQMLTVLDTYVAILLSLGGTVYRLIGPRPDPAAFPILAILVALTLSTYAQALFGLEPAAGVARYRSMPLPVWRILLAKDIAWLAVLLVLVLPLDPAAGLAFGFTALAIGHVPSVFLRAPQQRWRFTAGRVMFGVMQMVAGAALGFAASRQSAAFGLVSAALWLLSLWVCGRRGID
jgi:hypothetical protein